MSIVVRLGLCLIAFAAQASRLGGQQQSAVLRNYQLGVWRAQDGVRLAFTSNLVQTSDGYLWLSTQSGLTRFDGVRFQVFDGTNSPALRGRFNLQTYPLLEDAQGVLWIGSDLGLVRYKDGVFAAPAPELTFATDLVNDAVRDSAGGVWAITRLGRLFRVSSSGLEAVHGTSTQSLGSSMTVDVFGDIWIAAGAQGAYRVHRDSISAVTFPPDAQITEVNRLFAAPDSSLWIGTATSIVRWRHGRIRRIPMPPNSGRVAVSRFAIGPDSALWIGTEGAGLYRFDGRRFAHLSRADGLSDDRIIDIMVDRSHNIWVATRDGLNRLQPMSFPVFTIGNGLPTALPGGMVRDTTGTVWLAPPTGGLFRGRMANGQARFAQMEPASGSDLVTALSIGRNGAVWVGRRGGSVSRFAAGSAAQKPVVEGLPPVTDIVEDSAGTLFVGTWHGLFRRRHGDTHFLGVRDGLPDDAVHRMLRDSRGTLWVATQSGIARASPDDTRFTAVSIPNGVANRAAVLFEAPPGTLWLGSSSGLARITGGSVALITTAQGLPDNWVGAGEQDGAGNVWLGQLAGITRVALNDLERVADGRAASLTSVVSYASLDGLPGGDPTAWPHPWSFRDPDGLLWFAMGHGITTVDARRLPAEVRGPALTIEQLLIDGRLLASTTTATLGATAQRIELRYSGIDLANGPGVRFRYRLEGFDTTWVDAGLQRSASYTRLAAGKYHFRVAGRASQGSWSPAEATADIVVLAPLYRRSWFLALAGITFALALWTAHLTSMRTRSIAIREERSRLAREIHDSLLQGFGGIALQLHATAQRFTLSDQERPLLDRIMTLIEATLKQARDTVWDMRLRDAPVIDLAKASAAAAERFLAHTGCAFRVVQHGRVHQLSRNARSVCVRIIEEALSNVGQHAQASEAVVELDYDWRRLRVTVKDNGRGADIDLEQKRPGHWGLLGMRERASQIGARLALESTPGVGTIVSLEVGYARRILTNVFSRDDRD